MQGQHPLEDLIVLPLVGAKRPIVQGQNEARVAKFGRVLLHGKYTS